MSEKSFAYDLQQESESRVELNDGNGCIIRIRPGYLKNNGYDKEWDGSQYGFDYIDGEPNLFEAGGNFGGSAIPKSYPSSLEIWETRVAKQYHNQELIKKS